MERVRRLPALACAAAFGLLGPLPSSYADNAEWAMLNCGFTASNDSTGAVQQDPNVQMGFIWSGPTVAADFFEEDSGVSPHAGTVAITKHCWIQVNNPTPTHDLVPSSQHCDVAGDVVAFSGCQVTFTALATDNVYFCTRLELRHGDITEYWEDDSDGDPGNGIQCDLAISFGQEGSLVPRGCSGPSHLHQTIVGDDH